MPRIGTVIPEEPLQLPFKRAPRGLKAAPILAVLILSGCAQLAIEAKSSTCSHSIADGFASREIRQLNKAGDEVKVGSWGVHGRIGGQRFPTNFLLGSEQASFVQYQIDEVAPLRFDGEPLTIKVAPSIAPFVSPDLVEAGARDLGYQASICTDCQTDSRIELFPACPDLAIDRNNLCRDEKAIGTRLGGLRTIERELPDYYISKLCENCDELMLLQSTYLFALFATYNDKAKKLEHVRCYINPMTSDALLQNAIDSCLSRALGGVFNFSSDPKSNFFVDPELFRDTRERRWSAVARQSLACGSRLK